MWTESGLRAEAERQNHAFADAVKREQPSRNSRPVSPQSHICKDFTSVAQTPDFTDIFYVSKIGQTVSSMSKIQHQWIAPKRSALGGNKIVRLLHTIVVAECV